MPYLKRKMTTAAEFAEKVLKTDIRYIARGGFWLTVGRGASMLSSLLLSIAFANLLPKETYGSYKYILSIASVMSLFTLPGMNTAVTQAVARGHEKTLFSATKERIKWGAIGSVVGLCVAGYYLVQHNAFLAIATSIVAIFLPFMDPFTTYNAFLQGKKNFKWSTLAGNIMQICTAVILLIGMWLSKNALVILVLYFAANALMRYFVFRRVSASVDRSTMDDTQALSYGKHLSAMNILGEIAGNLDNFLAFHFLGPTGVASYSIATAPADQAKGFLSFSDPLLFPQFSKHSDEDIRKHIGRKFFWYGVFGAVVVAGYWIVAPFFFRLVLPQYADMIFLSLLYSLSLLNAVSTPAIIYLGAKRKIKEQYISTLCAYLFQIGSMTLLTAYYGLPGLIVARILTRYFGASLNIFFFLKPFPQKAT